jgi:cobalt-zinc-cadmium efflux system membrane fusion protein
MTTRTIEVTPPRLFIAAVSLIALVAGTAWIARRAPVVAPLAPDKGDKPSALVTLSPEAMKNAALELVDAGPGDITVTMTLPGEVSLNEDALVHVSPRVPGVVHEVRKALGDVVKKGDVLAVLLSREFAAVQIDLLQAREQVTLAESTWAREEKLWKDHLTTEKDYLAAKQGLAAARLSYGVAARKLDAIGGSAPGEKSNGYALIAPIAGTVIAKDIALGEVLKDDTLVYTLADLSTLWVNVSVYAQDLPKMQVGLPVVVSAEGIEGTVDGKVSFLGPLLGERTRTAIARVVLSSPSSSWRPGLFVTARVQVATVRAPVVVLEDAVQVIGGAPMVFVEQAAGSFDGRTVRLGRKGRGPEGRLLVEVIEGVPAGARYVAKNSFILKSQREKGASTGE